MKIVDALAEVYATEPEVKLVEVVVYRKTREGNLIRERVKVDFYSSGDYQWSSSVKPIDVE